MVGLEGSAERCGEICLVEVFGNTIENGTAALGQGIHKFRDPALVEDFTAERHTIDVGQPHAHQVRWRPGETTFLIDGAVTRTLAQASEYPMMLILGVFDFPDVPGDLTITPSMTVSRVSGTDLGNGSLIAR